MKKISPPLAVCYVVLISLFCWYLISSGNAKWLRVESPSGALQGVNYIVRVTIADPDSEMYLAVDLHWMNAEKSSLGYLSGTKSVKISSNKNVYEFSVPVPPDKNAAYIFPVIYLSKGGSWNDRISAAETEPVPVLMSVDKSTGIHFVQQKTRNIDKQIKMPKPESFPLSIAISVIWLAASLIALLKRKRYRTGLIAAAAFTSSAWEILGSSAAIGKILRYIAWTTGIYYDRHAPQQILTVIIIIIFAVVSFYLLNSIRRLLKNLPWICISVFWGIVILQIVSLHETDRLLSATIAGIQGGQILRLAASVICLAAIFYSIHSGNIRNQNDLS